MIEQLKEAAKGADLGALALDLEALIQDRLQVVSAADQLNPMLTMFTFLTTRCAYRAAPEVSPDCRKTQAIYVIAVLPRLGEAFQAQMTKVAESLLKEIRK